MDKRCLCGRPATHIAYLPSNIWAGLREIMEPHQVCDYHAAKARAKGFEVIWDVEVRKSCTSEAEEHNEKEGV